MTDGGYTREQAWQLQLAARCGRPALTPEEEAKQTAEVLAEIAELEAMDGEHTPRGADDADA